MDFHAEFFPKPFLKKIDHKDKILLVGSCFTEQIGNKLGAYKFCTLQNPNGILFNPASICKAVISYTKGKLYNESELFYYNELWGSWNHHTKFSRPHKTDALELINEEQKNAGSWIKQADWILITLGSSFVYENMNAENAEDYNNVVANCHKVPIDKFNHRLLDIDEIKSMLSFMIEQVKQVNPTVNFIFTISPVRHLREGFIENNRSKAALITAVHTLCNNEDVFYFPAYELIIDDLRDYRFYAEDMVHPNYAATNYVWEKFIQVAINEDSQQLMKEIAVIIAAKNHKPFNSISEQHKKFIAANLEKVKKISRFYSYIDFSEELLFFENVLL